MKGVNDDEIFNFLEYGAKKGIEIRFLELMRIGHACESQKKQFISSNEIKEIIKSRFELHSQGRALGATAVCYEVSNGSRIGFISSESNPFCGDCNRWRLSSDGKIFACLLKNEGLDVRNTTYEDRSSIYEALLHKKPNLRPKEVVTRMNSIGG